MHIPLVLCFLTTASASFTNMDYFKVATGRTPGEVRQMEMQKMAAFMNTSVNPCEDFLEYACGGRHNIEEFGKFSEIKKIKNKRVEELLRDPDIATTSQMRVRAKQFYDKCVEWHDYRRLFASDIMDKYSDWLKSQMENDEWDWLKIVANFSSQGISSFIDLNLHMENGEFFIVIEPKIDPVYRHMLNRLMDREPYRDLWEFSERLNTLISWGNRSNLVGAFPDSLKEIVESIDLQSYLSMRLGENLTRQIFVRDPLILNMIGEIINQTDRDIIQRFLYWRAYFHLNYKFEGYDRDCTTVTTELFKLPILEAMAASVAPDDSERDVFDIIERIHDEQYKMFSKISWFDAITKEHALEKIKAVNKWVALNSSILRDDCFRSVYESFNITDHSYIELALLNNMEDQLLLCVKNVECQFIDVPVTHINAQFTVGERFHFFIHMGVLMPPEYSYNFPFFKKFSGLGFDIGHELMHNFDADNIQRDAYAKRREWLPLSIKEKITKDFECAANFYHHVYGIDGHKTLSENIADIVGLKLAYDAYKTWLEAGSTSVETELEGFEEMNLNLDQLFFLSFAQSFCLTTQHILENPDLGDGNHANPTFRVRGAVSNLKAFAEAFECPSNSPMNPEPKCELFA